MNSCRSRPETRVGRGQTLLSHSSRAISRAGGKGAEKEGLKKVKEGISLLSIPSPTPPPPPASSPQRPCRSCARPRLAGALQPEALREGRRMALGTSRARSCGLARGNSRAWRQSLFRPSERGAAPWRGWYASPPMTRRGPTWADPWPTGAARSAGNRGAKRSRTGPSPERSSHPAIHRSPDPPHVRRATTTPHAPRRRSRRRSL